MIRTRTLKSGLQSLYLDGYPHSRSIALGLRIASNPKTAVDRKIVKETMVLAKKKAAKIQNELMKPEIYSGAELDKLSLKQKGEVLFYEFAKAKVREMDRSFDVYNTALTYFQIFRPDIKCCELTDDILTAFRRYLLTARKLKSDAPISKKSASVYLAALKSIANDYNPNLTVEPIEPGEYVPESLMIEELRKLANTDCRYTALKEMALFSALTGLRFIDIQQLQPTQIRKNENGWYLDFTQQKTGKDNILPISNQAYELLINNDFSQVDYKNMQRSLKKWLQDAGISREVTFHSFRHTYAMLLLGSGTDIFTVSKMLGHKSLNSTQVYVKALEKNKIKAANSIII